MAFVEVHKFGRPTRCNHMQPPTCTAASSACSPAGTVPGTAAHGSVSAGVEARPLVDRRQRAGSAAAAFHGLASAQGARGRGSGSRRAAAARAGAIVEARVSHVAQEGIRLGRDDDDVVAGAAVEEHHGCNEEERMNNRASVGVYGSRVEEVEAGRLLFLLDGARGGPLSDFTFSRLNFKQEENDACRSKNPGDGQAISFVVRKRCKIINISVLSALRNDHRYHSDSTASRLLSEVKHCRARLVLRWGTTLESLVLFFFLLGSFTLVSRASPLLSF